jgi:hypothetical protein
MQATANPLDRWVVLPMMRAIGTRRREAMLDKARIGDLAQAISLDDVLPGLTGWRCLRHDLGTPQVMSPTTGPWTASSSVATPS